MEFDCSPFFDQYLELRRAADDAFQRTRTEHPSCVTCRVGCSDCCYALFDLSLVEALYISSRVRAAFDAPTLKALMEEANRADRQVYRLKRDAYRDLQNGRNEREILEKMAAQRLRCPLLNAQERCDLYADRPITCRLYGIPTGIDGQSHTCGLSAFETGRAYPTANLDLINQRLRAISEAMARAMGSKHVRLGELLVPLSMAILTVFDEAYLGISSAEDKDKNTCKKAAS